MRKPMLGTFFGYNPTKRRAGDSEPGVSNVYTYAFLLTYGFHFPGLSQDWFRFNFQFQVAPSHPYGAIGARICTLCLLRHNVQFLCQWNLDFNWKDEVEVVQDSLGSDACPWACVGTKHVCWETPLYDSTPGSGWVWWVRQVAILGCPGMEYVIK